MTDRGIVLNYYDTVLLIRTVGVRMTWNQRHGLPITDLDRQRRQLLIDVLRFERILDRLKDPRLRIVITGRYALNMTVLELSEILGMSAGRTSKLCTVALDDLTASSY